MVVFDLVIKVALETFVIYEKKSNICNFPIFICVIGTFF